MRGVALLLLLLLLVPSSVASWEGGAVESVAVRDAVLLGGRTVFQVLGAEEDTRPALDLQAERLHVEEWLKKEDVNAADTVTYTHGPNTTQTSSDWTDAHVTVADARPDVRLFLHGASEVRVEDARMVVGGHARPSVAESSTSQYHREPTTIPVPTLHEVGATSGLLTVRGDFSLSVYEWDLLVQNSTGSREYWSGFQSTEGSFLPHVPGSQHQRLYLDVTNGTLRLPLAGLDVRDLFVAGTTLDAASAVLDLPGADAPLSLSGPLRFGLGAVDDGAFQGRPLPPDTAAPDAPPGTDAVAPAPQTASSSLGSGSLWTTLVVVALAVAGVLVGRRALRLLRLRRARDDGDYRSVAAAAGLENSRRFGAEVVVARVVCMVKTGEFAAAAALLEKRGDRLAPAVCAYLWACIHAGSGAVEDAREAVVRSVLADPGMAVEVAANGSLRRFLADVGEGGYS